jgi:hypothetical protein
MARVNKRQDSNQADRERNAQGHDQGSNNGQPRELSPGTVFLVLDVPENGAHRGVEFIVQRYYQATRTHIAVRSEKGYPKGPDVSFRQERLFNPRLCEIFLRKEPAKRKTKSVRKPSPLNNGDAKPEIEVTTQRHIVRDESVVALARDSRIYSRGDVLAMAVRPEESTIRLPGGAVLRNAKRVPRIIPIDDANMGCLLTENIQYYQIYTDNNGIESPCDCHPPESGRDN